MLGYAGKSIILVSSKTENSNIWITEAFVLKTFRKRSACSFRTKLTNTNTVPNRSWVKSDHRITALVEFKEFIGDAKSNLSRLKSEDWLLSKLYLFVKSFWLKSFLLN